MTDELCSIISDWLNDFNCRYGSTVYVQSQFMFIQIGQETIQIANIADNVVVVADRPDRFFNIYYQPDFGFFSTLEASILDRIYYHTKPQSGN